MGIAYNKHKTYPQNIYIRDFSGKVDVHEIIHSWQFLLNNDLLNSETKGVINNLTDCQLDMDMGSFHVLMDFLKKYEQLHKIKLAVICNDPHTIVFPTLGEMQERSLRIKPFASEDPAVKWIMEEA